MNISIRSKIIGGFVVVFAIGMVLGNYGLYSINRISKMSEEQTEIQEANASILDVLSKHYIWRQDLTISVFTNTEFKGSFNPDTCALGVWRNSDEAHTVSNDNINSLLTQLDVPHSFIHTKAEEVMEMMKFGKTVQAKEMFTKEIQPQADEAISLLRQMADEYAVMLEEKTTEVDQYRRNVLTVIISLIIIAVILSVGLAAALIKSIMGPLRSLAASANTVASGSLSVNFKYSVNDEIGLLTDNFASLVDIFKKLISDINKMSKEHTAGNIDYFIETDQYNGEFQDVATGINSMISEYVEIMNTVLATVGEYADGDFSAKLAPLPGKKGVANTILDSVSDNLGNVEQSVMLLVDGAINGELDKRIESSKFKGGWKNIVDGMNELLEAVDTPLAEAQNALSLVSRGNLDAKVTGRYKGQFGKMSDSINQTIEFLSTYIKEISSVLNEMASDNFNIEITREYQGSFSDIKVSLVSIIERLNIVMKEIGQAAEQVATGAGQISQTSMQLSQGATMQASSIEELDASIQEINSKIADNAENSVNANELSSTAKNNADRGNTEMKSMLVSMSDINEASQSISKIIKVIDDIAFQTNLLALNAAVEAARAGEHGKGFAVVAEEVRNLATRSQEAAKETSGLIEHSIDKVNEGAKIANATAEALAKIFQGITDVSEMIGKIETSSKEQAVAISQINEGVGHISGVTQGNSATSEECAAAAEELSSQADMLNELISRFNIKA